VSEAESAGRELQIEELPTSLKLIAETVADLKGTELLVLDVRELASFTDFMVICNGRSDRHVQAIVDAIIAKLRAEEVTPLHTEGYEQANWVLVDFVDFLVNVFTPDTRNFYQLERVWRDAPVLVGERPERAPSKGRDPAAAAVESAKSDDPGAAADEPDES
jgi:ribosome-associated protein